MSDEIGDRPDEFETDLPHDTEPAGPEPSGERRRRKERVLHTRVSETLADDIRRMAEDLRVPASNLVRNVLEEVFDVVESVSDDVGDLFEEMLDEAEGARDRVFRARARAKRRRHGRRARERGEQDRAGLQDWVGEQDRAAWDAARREVDEAEVRSAGGGPPPPPIEWHVVEEGRARGPLGPDELAVGVRARRLGPDTLVWCAGMADWKRAREVPSLASLFAPPPPPVPEEA